MKAIISQFHFLCLLLLGTCPVLGQQYLFTETETKEKHSYSSALDSLWSSNTYIKKLSADGNWIAFSEHFPEQENKLYVYHTQTQQHFHLTYASRLAFSANNNWFAALSNQGELQLLNLNTGKQQVLSTIQNFSFSPDGSFLAYTQSYPNKPPVLILKNLKTTVETRFSKHGKFVWHPHKNIILLEVLAPNHKVIKLELASGKTTLLKKIPKNKLATLQWNTTGTAILMKLTNEDKQLLAVYSSKGKLKELDSEDIKNKYPNYQLSTRTPKLDDNGEKVLFYRQLKEVSTHKKSSVEIWCTDTPWIYPRMKFYKKNVQEQLLTAWYPETNQLNEVETIDFPSASMQLNEDTALVFNLEQYEPLYKYEPNADIYFKNIRSGKKQKVIENQYTESAFIKLSPEQKHIAYFKNNDWWVYQVESGKRINMTKELEFSFANTERDYAGDLYPYGCAGWFPDDKYIVLYDRYDIWLISPDGKKKKKITKGRAQNKRYRLGLKNQTSQSFSTIGQRNYSSFLITPQKGLLLNVFDHKHYQTGFAFWEKGKSPTPLLLDDYKIDALQLSHNFNSWVYRKQRFNKPVGIYAFNKKTRQEQLLYQSNKKLLDYDLGKAKTFRYLTKTGKSERASLLYPSHYDKDKTYPMIVHLYEREAQKVLDFNPPIDYYYRGFSPLKFITQGYFVLYLDISYTLGDPGMSALASVNAAVDKVIASEQIDENKIGLIGHSFGGYETAFIVTKTDRFTAAVAGAAATDLVNAYHNIFWEMNYTQLWRMENQQFRMGKSFYKNKEAYYRNSPLHHIEQVNTPLLLWTGKEDTNINWTQSVNMFIALKRLNKKGKLLLFEKEGHVLFQKRNQKKLTTSIFNWMEKYLKEG